MAFNVLLGQRGGMNVARRTDAVLLLVALVWGSSYLAAKTATAALPVLAVLFARYAISALACGALVAFRSRRSWTRAEFRVGSLLGSPRRRCSCWRRTGWRTPAPRTPG